MPESVTRLVLASASPRRSELLRQIGVAHRVVIADIDEQTLPGESARDCVMRLAREKALRTAARTGDAAVAVLGADTAVVIDGDMLGKPRGPADALAMLERLSARQHEVLSAVALAHRGFVRSELSRSVVQFRAITRAEAEAYWATAEPRDKAGGYAVQGYGAVFIESLQGSYSGVMGLPLFETAALLAAAGVPMWQAPGQHE